MSLAQTNFTLYDIPSKYRIYNHKNVCLKKT